MFYCFIDLLYKSFNIPGVTIHDNWWLSWLWSSFLVLEKFPLSQYTAGLTSVLVLNSRIDLACCDTSKVLLNKIVLSPSYKLGKWQGVNTQLISAWESF